MKTIFKEIAYGSSEWKESVKLREKILREPLGSKFTDKELKEEKNHIQIAGFLDKKLIATAVLVPDAEKLKMQRVVVKHNLRSLNIGSEMMIFCENIALNRTYKTMYCHARDSAVNFYLKNKYKKLGDYFNEDGIPHLKMEKKLD